MKRRWLIRGCCLGLLLLCVGAWRRSHYYDFSIFYKHSDDYLLIGVGEGAVYMGRGWGNYDDELGQGFDYTNYQVSKGYSNHGRPGAYYLFGFYYYLQSDDWSKTHLVGIPFWFLSGILIIISIFIWHKTGKPKLVGAFPVEMKIPGAM